MRLHDSNPPRSLKSMMGKTFDISAMGPGLKRGMVLSVYRAKIKQLTGDERFLADLKYATMLPQDGEGYAHPRLIIRFTNGSPWIAELHMQRYRLNKLINKRLGCDFICKIIIK